jgi:hypothetical protein
VAHSCHLASAYATSRLNFDAVRWGVPKPQKHDFSLKLTRIIEIRTGCRKGEPPEYHDAVLVLKALIWDGPSGGDINAKLGVIKTIAGWVKFRAL